MTDFASQVGFFYDQSFCVLFFLLLRSIRLLKFGIFRCGKCYAMNVAAHLMLTKILVCINRSVEGV